MATYQGTKLVSVEAGSAISIYRFIVAAADGQYDHVATAQTRADGVSAQAADAAGKTLAMVIPNGAIAKVEAGAAVSRGAQVASDNQGRAIAHVSGAGNYILGVALDAASAAGEVIRVQLTAPHQDGVT